MKKLLTFFMLILLAGCGGGQSALGTLPGAPASPVSGEQTALQLELSAEKAEDNWRVVLAAPRAADLYQLAGTLVFDSTRYTIVDVQPGGGLGGPADSYFIWDETAAGAIDFAYTRRFFGPGANGDVRLLEVLVSALGEFRPDEFRLNDQPEALIARDSAKRNMPVTTCGGAQL